ncbi:MAG: hypothetical protein NC184_07625, partial [Roseburia sp.]|nr:hypothetical protein [Roseburia sp.]
MSPVAPFILDPTQAAEFEKIEAPELAITNKTLKEALDTVGGYIHGIPRLVPDADGKLRQIHYDMLGGTEEAALSDPKYKPITNIYTQSVEDYATELDSPSENLVNTIDVAEPFAYPYPTLHTATQYSGRSRGQ